MKISTIIRSIIATAIAFPLVSGSALAAGFQVSETSVSGLGLAFAGAGITGNGPADLFHNPAGLMLGTGRDFQFGLHSIHPNAQFKNLNSTETPLLPTISPPTPATGIEANGGEDALVPNFFYAADLGTNLRYGIGITSPFGLTTEYNANWIGRYHAIKTELITVEINPAVAYKVNDTFSIGAGITLITADAELSRALYTGAGNPDARATVEGDDTGVGFNFGIVVGDENARIGLGYRSRTALELDGDLTIPALGVKTGANADLNLPSTIYLSGFKKLSDQFDLFATIRHTDWSEFEELRIELDNGGAADVTPQNWKNSNTYSIGLRYRPTDRWTVRAGYARDESPIKNDTYRTPRIPDSNREWLTAGGSYQATPRMRIDFSFAHLFTDDAAINQTTLSGIPGATPQAVASNLNGKYEDTAANIFALQLHIDLNK